MGRDSVFIKKGIGPMSRRVCQEKCVSNFLITC